MYVNITICLFFQIQNSSISSNAMKLLLRGVNHLIEKLSSYYILYIRICLLPKCMIITIGSHGICPCAYKVCYLFITTFHLFITTTIKTNHIHPPQIYPSHDSFFSIKESCSNNPYDNSVHFDNIKLVINITITITINFIVTIKPG